MDETIPLYPSLEDYNPNITESEWEDLVTDKKVFTENSLITFACLLNAEDSSCKCMPNEFGRDWNFYNRGIWQTGRRVYLKTKCPILPNGEGGNSYWSVCCTGYRPKGDKGFIFKIRPELLSALNKTGVLKGVNYKMTKFSWLSFYKEFANKLLEYKDDRTELVNIIFKMDKHFVDYIHLNDNKHDYKQYTDLDPFSVFAIFNRKLTEANRLEICRYIKSSFNLKSDIPTDFEGIPILLPTMSIFAWREDVDTTIPILWNLFEAAIKEQIDEKDFESKFDIALKQRGLKWNLTIGLYWIRPNRFVPLDGCSRKYLPKIQIDLFKEKDLNGENYLKLIDDIKYKIDNKEISEQNFVELSYNAWAKEPQPEEEELVTEGKYSKYVELLKKNKNIILHGAPGTGKTFMARAIANEMGCSDDNIDFVQFHPSYDYTDFVEGLRPTSSDENGTILFERRNGIFKDFCLKAINNEYKIDASIDAKNMIESFLTKSIESEKLFKSKLDSEEFKIIKVTDKSIIIDHKNKNINLSLKSLLDIIFTKKKIQNLQDTTNSYIISIYNEIIKDLPELLNINVTENSFVFIIDEINRGELSKIFGELFYSLDPGYRGIKGNTKTQYQNLVKEDDEFFDGFYIPENVYIIGTMNDIDRSVESMDFAMRRRFAFIEVTAEDSANNMGLSESSVNKMNAINAEIEKIDGLNKSYYIGGAYFLKVDNEDRETDALTFPELWDFHLEGLLREYLRGIIPSDELEIALTKIKEAYDNAE